MVATFLIPDLVFYRAQKSNVKLTDPKAWAMPSGKAAIATFIQRFSSVTSAPIRDHLKNDGFS